MNKPELLYTSPLGATIHSYEISGGKTVYERFLGCFLGNCTFYNTMDEARKGIDYRFS